MTPKSVKTRGKILDQAFVIAHRDGLLAVNSVQLAKDLSMARSVIHYHYENMPALINSVVELAVEKEDLSIIRDAILLRHPAINKMDPTLRQRAFS